MNTESTENVDVATILADVQRDLDATKDRLQWSEGRIQYLEASLHAASRRLDSLSGVDGLTHELMTATGAKSVEVEDDEEGTVTIELTGVRLEDGLILTARRSYLVTVEVPMTATLTIEVEDAEDVDDATAQAEGRVQEDRWEFTVDHRSLEVDDFDVDVWSIDVQEVTEQAS